MRNGDWNESIGNSIYGKTLGILGYGRHGKPVARLAESFGMRVIARDRTNSKSPKDEFGVQSLSLDEVMSQSDVVSIQRSTWFLYSF